MLNKLVEVNKNEYKPLILSFIYFFCLLCGYYILRPVRDEMGIQGGVENLHWLFTGTFVVMLGAVPVFGAAVSRFPRRKLVPIVYYFFIINLVLFFLLFRSGFSKVWTARIFFIWLSVFNLFVVSVFWSLMTDIFTNEQSRRLFGFIAAGGTTGAIAGPSITAMFSRILGPQNLLIVSAAFLMIAVICIHLLLGDRDKEQDRSTEESEDRTLSADIAMGGSVFAGFINVMKSPYLIGISVFIVLYTTLSTFLYFIQANIVEDAFNDPASRTSLFASIDLAVNTLTILCQIFVTGKMANRMGISFTLMLIPLLVTIGFISLGIFPILAALVIFQVIRRAGNYALTRPAREMLFTVIPREDKYKAKNFIDTVVYRGGDAVSGWGFAGLSAIGFSISQISFIAVPIAAVWVATSYFLGRKQEDIINMSNKIKNADR